MQAAAMDVLRVLSDHVGEEEELLSNESLNAALDPFRGVGPISVHCGLEGCNRTISWWGLPVRGEPPFAHRAGPAFGNRSRSPERLTGFVFGNALSPIEGARVVHSSWGPRRAEVRGVRVNRSTPGTPTPTRTGASASSATSTTLA
jgi:hypothetical protein